MVNISAHKVRGGIHADKDREVMVYCYDGNSSLGAVAYFLENGFKHVASMRGGIILQIPD